MTRFLKNLVLVPIAIVLIALAVANRHVVTLSLDPFNRVDPALSLDVPLFWILFAAVAVGVFNGGGASWAAPGNWRKESRGKPREADRWHSEADRLKAQQEGSTGGGKAIASRSAA